ncbi:MAG TPA: histidine phosphatase family protein [Caulobacteraceae bacterium]|nr:histidine phosphatase family protein [Caulobacteraceae bacterium]
MTRILLIRHGHVEGIVPERFRGRTEVPLSELGRGQAAATAARLAAGRRFALVYTSPMGRCLETARAIAAAGRAEVETLPSLTDLDYGAWQWKTYDEVRAAQPELFARWFAAPETVRFPGGDSLQDLVARTADALRTVIEERADDTVVMVGHDSVNRSILMQVLDQPLSAYWRIAQSPCAINEIEVGEGEPRVPRVNDTAHLDAVDPITPAGAG